MPKRPDPPTRKPRRKWDRQRIAVMALAVFIVLVMVVSTMAPLFYGDGG